MISKTAEKEIPRIAIPVMSRTRQSRPNRYRTVASNVAAVVDKGGGRGQQQPRRAESGAKSGNAKPAENRLVVSAMPNRQANNNVAAVRVNLPLRSNTM